MHENFPVGGIITKGLGHDACKGLVITTQFHLFCDVQVVVTTPGGSGGSFPMEPGEIHNFYQPVSATNQPFSKETPYLTPYDFDPTKQGKKLIKINVKMNDHEIEKEYLVGDRKAHWVVKVLNLFNVTQSRMKVAVSGIKRITTRAIVKIRNLRKKNRNI